MGETFSSFTFTDFSSLHMNLWGNIGFLHHKYTLIIIAYIKLRCRNDNNLQMLFNVQKEAKTIETTCQNLPVSITAEIPILCRFSRLTLDIMAMVFNYMLAQPVVVCCKSYINFRCFFLPSVTVAAERQCFHKCLSFWPRGGGICPIACWDTHPLGRHPPYADTPAPPRWPLQQMVRILLECILV